MSDKILFDKPGNFLYPIPAVMVSCGSMDRPNIITIAWTGTICSDPPMVSISVRPERYSHDIIRDSGEFVVNLTTARILKACDYCGVKSGRDVDKFEGGRYATSENGLYYLPEYTNALLSGKVVDYYDYGTHTLFVAEVTEAKTLSKDPSVTYEYYQKNIKPKPQAKEEAKSEKGKWVCKICGYVHEGDELPDDFICPWCKHPAEDFEKVN